MKKKIISLLLVAAMALTLCACGHEHIWTPATCTEPKTCAECGETEGEALGHVFKDATHFAAPECAVCGAVEGEPLAPDFETYGFNVINISEIPVSQYLDSTIKYKTSTYRSSYSTTASVNLYSYEVFDSDATHEAKEGYEWHCATFRLLFSDYDYRNSGFRTKALLTDYYDIPATEDSYVQFKDGSTIFSTYIDGIEYPCECMVSSNVAEQGTVQFDEKHTLNQASVVTWQFDCQIPVGYDGVVLCFINPKNLDGGSISETADRSTVFIRFDK